MLAQAVSINKVVEFQRFVQEFAWFSEAGRPLAGYQYRLLKWQDWRGPEVLEVYPYAVWTQQLHDRVLAGPTAETIALKSIWKELLTTTFNSAARHLASDCQGDAWHPQSAAAWSAAWTVALLGIHFRTSGSYDSCRAGATSAR